jgi:hypothetical protein
MLANGFFSVLCLPLMKKYTSFFKEHTELRAAQSIS